MGGGVDRSSDKYVCMNFLGASKLPNPSLDPLITGYIYNLNDYNVLSPSSEFLNLTKSINKFLIVQAILFILSAELKWHVLVYAVTDYNTVCCI